MIKLDFETCFNISSSILMEGALGERLKREFNIKFDDKVAMAKIGGTYVILGKVV